MAEVYIAHHTRRDITVALASGDGTPKTYTLKLHAGESLTMGGPVTEPVRAKDQNGRTWAVRPGPVTEDAMISLGKVRIWDLGKNTTEGVAGDIVAVTGYTGGNPVAGYMDTDWAVVTGDPASAGYQTFTVTITVADFGTQKGGIWTGVGFVHKAPKVIIDDEGTFYDGLEMSFPAGLSYTRNA